jgi:hypothetical protein
MIQKPGHAPRESRIGIKQVNLTLQMHAQVLAPQVTRGLPGPLSEQKVPGKEKARPCD